MWESLDQERASRLVGVASHTAGFLLPIVDRPVSAVTVLRKPADRALSHHAFKARPGPTTDPAPTLPERRLSIEEIYERFGGGKADESHFHRLAAGYFNGQARSLLDPHVNTADLRFTDAPPHDADMWRKRLRAALKGYDLVGVREHFEEFVDVLARRQGWEVRRIPWSKRNTERVRASDAEMDLIRRHNWLDRELYKSCAKRWS
jgi:hypothetical protein